MASSGQWRVLGVPKGESGLSYVRPGHCWVVIGNCYRGRMARSWAGGAAVPGRDCGGAAVPGRFVSVLRGAVHGQERDVRVALCGGSPIPVEPKTALASSLAHYLTISLALRSNQAMAEARPQEKMITIPKRPLGNTGLQISVLGFGASPLGGVFHDVDAEEGKKAVRLAFERGVNFFDTSPFYGDKRSEIALGRAIADLPRSEIVVATKVGRYGAETFDFSAERVRKSVDESLERLGLEVIDLIQCHDMEFVCLDQIVNETLPALLELKRQGKVRFVGITGLPLKIFKDVLDRAPAGSVDCVLSYCHYTMLDDTLDGLIPYLQSKNVGIINASPLCMGLLTRRGPPSWHPAPQEVLDAARRATAAADETGLDIANVALQFSLKNEKIATTLVGMCTPQQVEENCSAALRALGIDSGEGAMYEEVTGRVTEILGAVHNVTWHSGLPENN